MGSPDWHERIFDIPLQRTANDRLSFTWRSHGKRLSSASEDLEVQRGLTEMLPTGTKPETSSHRPPERERRGKRRRSTIRLERTRQDCLLELFRRQNRKKKNNFWSACELSRAPRCHLELNRIELNQPTDQTNRPISVACVLRCLMKLKTPRYLASLHAVRRE